MSESNNDDWAMTRVNAKRPQEPIQESFDKTTPNFNRSDVEDWDALAQPRKHSPPASDWDKTYIPHQKQSTPKSGDWDLTQANIQIPKNDIVNFNVPNVPQDDWGMTVPHVDKRNFDIDFGSVPPPRSSGIGMPRSGMTEVGFHVPVELNPPAIPLSEVSTQKKATSDVNKWLYFVAGAFTMFVFMMVFLAAVGLIVYFK
jgi:hypothetical protein